MAAGKPSWEGSGRSYAHGRPNNQAIGATVDFVTSRPVRQALNGRSGRVSVCSLSLSLGGCGRGVCGAPSRYNDVLILGRVAVERAPSGSTYGDLVRKALLDARIGVAAGLLNNRGGLRAGPVDVNHVVPGEHDFHDPVIGCRVDPALRPPCRESGAWRSSPAPDFRLGHASREHSQGLE